jgi:hypothetical protein
MLILAGAAALVLTWFVFEPLYRKGLPGRLKRKNLCIKAIPTTIATLFAGAAFFLFGGDRYSLLIFIALAVCTAADVMLGIKFIVGGVLFFAGHILYIAALWGCHSPTWWSLFVFLAAVPALWLFLQQYADRIPGKLLFAGIMLYSTALGALLAFSLPLPFLVPGRRSVFAALGAALFVLSDMGTCRCMLTKTSERFNAVSLGIYYTAQIFLGMSAFI